MTHAYLISLRLRAFQRKFLPDWPIFKIFFSKVEKYSVKKLPAIYEELEIENLDFNTVTAPYLFSRGKFEFYIFILSSALLCFFVDYFPMALTDFLYEVCFFLWYNPLIFILGFPLFACVVLLFIPKHYSERIRAVSLYSGFILYFFVLITLGRFDLSSNEFQFQFRLVWEFEADVSFFDCVLGVDGLSIALIALSSFIFTVCFLLGCVSIHSLIKEYFISLFFLLFFILLSFTALDIILFYMSFEATLIPLFILIGVWGTRERKIYAAYKLFFYTLVGSLCTLVGLTIVVFSVGSGDLTYLVNLIFSPYWQKWVWVLLFLSFAVKLPMIPVHLWLPEAHVEAPTGGSIILAAILLKLGGYGFFRFLLPLCPDATIFFSPLLALLSCFAIIYAALLALRQIDIKKLVAYSSIAHMGFVSLSLVVWNFSSLAGGVFIMLSHGFSSGALFACIGILYDRYKTKLLPYFKSLATVMPLFSLFFFCFILVNISLPGTSAFIGEFFVFLGVFAQSFVLMLISGVSVILVVGYSLWMFNRMSFGQVSTKFITIYADISAAEALALSALLIPLIFFGCFPGILLDYFTFFIDKTSLIPLFK